MEKKPWYIATADEVVRVFSTDSKRGLSDDEVRKRRDIYGYNRLPEKPQEAWLFVFLRQLQSPFIYLLVAAAIFKLMLASYHDAIIIGFILVVNALIGMFQEGRAQSLLASLKKILKTSCIVIRNDKRIIVDEAALVPGDLIILQEGWRVPADIRLLETASLKVDEASLTGESIGVEKNNATLTNASVALANQTNMLFMGTFVLAGTGFGIVVATGTSTELGKIQQVFEEAAQPEMPLKKDLDLLAYASLLVSVTLSIIFFIIGVIRGYGWQNMLFTLTSLFVSIVPESIPIIATIVLALGAYRMARTHVLIKTLPTIEALGRIQVLIVDKTGTLTRNEQMVVEVYAHNQHYTVIGEGYVPYGQILYHNKPLITPLEPATPLAHIARAAALLDYAEISYTKHGEVHTLKGEPIQAALGVFAAKAGIDKHRLQQEYTLVEESPFNVARRISSMTYKQNGKTFTLYIGSPETIMAMHPNISAATHAAFDAMVTKGLRVLGMAQDDTFLGLIGMQDALRTDVAQTVREAKAAGIRIVMATGDHKDTAMYVGRETGIYEEGDEILEGEDFRTLSDRELERKLTNATIIARVTPSDKVDIIRAYRYRGTIVGMTGDGVNDAPALALADVGIAMGRIGTEVAKNIADIILLDDSLQSIITGIAQGRSILISLRRIILYLLTENFSEVAIICLSVLLGLPLPLLALQILWQHLMTDSFLDVGLSMEPAEQHLTSTEAPPSTLFDYGIFKKIARMACIAIAGTLGVFLWYYPTNIALARTMVSVTFTFFQWFNTWNLRSEYKSIFMMNPFSNLWLLGMSLAVVISQIFMFSTPWMLQAFSFVPLTWQQWCVAASVASLIIWTEEFHKWRKRRSLAAEIK